MFCRLPGAVGGTRAVAAVALSLSIAACSSPREAITVDEGMITIENLTESEWRNVRITVNDHFGGGVSSLAAGGRLNAPLSDFQTGLGQKFDRGRQSVYKIEVTATEPSGKPVTLSWGTDQHR